MLAIAICLAALGAAGGSFASAVVWRLHRQLAGSKDKKLSILNGRSMCPSCKHQLVWYDLVPLISWLVQKGRCRYCQKPISFSYLSLEIMGALTFAASYLWWPADLSANTARLQLAGWLLVFTGLLALAFYDLRWKLLPSRILYPSAAVAIIVKIANLGLYDSRPLHSVELWAGSIAVASGIFWLLYQLSQGRWIGYGDVRLGLISGTVLASPQKSLLMIFLASILGSLAALPGLLTGKRQLNSQIPYGPFLITATAISVLFGQSLLDWYQRLLT